MWERILKPVLVAAIMAGSVFYLTADKQLALLAGAIPLVLGVVGVLAGVAYGLAGVTFICAIGWAFAPADVRMQVRTEIQKALGRSEPERSNL